MRTTVNLAEDVAAALETLRRRRRIGLSDAVNELVRAGLAAGRPATGYRQRSFPMGIRVDVANVGEVLDLLDEWDAEERAGGT
jgi:hypothetical protein